MQNCTLFLYEILNYNRLTLESQSSEKYTGGEMKRKISLKGNNNAKNNKTYEEVRYILQKKFNFRKQQEAFQNETCECFW